MVAQIAACGFWKLTAGKVLGNNERDLRRRRSAGKDAVAVYDVGGCIRLWGRCGILFGGLLGFVLGAAFVANPLASDVLTFGTIGTLVVCVIECAVVGGGFAALLAAINGPGVLRGHTMGFARTLATGRPPSYIPMSSGKNFTSPLGG